MSHTRVKLWEQCPMAYKLKYLDRAPAQPIDHLDLGIVVHKALELAVSAAATEARPLTPSDTQNALREAWGSQHVAGVDQYTQAVAMLEAFATDESDLNTAHVLGIEAQFSIDVGGVTLVGVMDRVDRINDDTIEVVDYKTGAMIPSADDLANNLQLTLYQHAAQQLWPWAKNVKLTLHMVRHGVKLHTTRTPEQVAQALEYVAATAQQIATAAGRNSYPCALSAACGTCQFRLSCPTYRVLLQQPENEDIDPADAAPRTIEAVVAQRERVTAVLKALGSRKQELDGILRHAIHQKGQVDAGGRSYVIRNVQQRSYPVVDTIARVASATGERLPNVAEQVASISNTKLTAFLKGLGMPKPKTSMLLAELQATAQTSYISQIIGTKAS